MNRPSTCTPVRLTGASAGVAKDSRSRPVSQVRLSMPFSISHGIRGLIKLSCPEPVEGPTLPALALALNGRTSRERLTQMRLIP